MNNEKILWLGNPHWIANYTYAILGGILIFFALVFLCLSFSAFGFFFVFLIFAIPGGISIYAPFCIAKYTKYTVTDSKIIVSFDFIISTEKIIRIADIREIATGQNLLDKIFNVGNVSLSTSASFSLSSVFRGIADFKEVCQMIQNLQ